MSPERIFQFDLDETFPHLPSAPVVEAVIHLTARMNPQLSPEGLHRDLEQQLEAYPEREDQHQVSLIADLSADGALSNVRNRRWSGIRATSADKLQIAQFNRDGFVFSRLQPYETWEKFSQEGLRLWAIFARLAGCTTVQRIGVRFINRIMPIQVQNLQRYLSEFPRPLDHLGLPVSDFVYSTSHEVPGFPLQLNVVRTVQPLATPHNGQAGLILDLDVFTTQELPYEGEIVEEYLKKMRWIKDKAFFSLLNPVAIEQFK